MLLIISSRSQNNLYLQYCCVLSKLLWHSRSLWFLFVLLSEEIQFLCWGFPFLAMFNFFFCIRFRVFIAWNVHRFVVFFPQLFSGDACVVCIFFLAIRLFCPLLCSLQVIVSMHCFFFFVLLSEEIQFLCWGFLSLAMFTFFYIRFRVFIAWNIHRFVFLPQFCFLVIFVLLMLVL